ncbi:hypothetical protein GCM10010344_50490 [Streptomyces bluensis]|nr:hypothetical protein GCM10010344_50490 [Streptomyces bluensis]
MSLWLTASWHTRVPVASEPPDVRHEHRIRDTDTPELPADLRAGHLSRREGRGIFVGDPVIGPHIDHDTGSVRATGEEVRGMASYDTVLLPTDPEGLRSDSDDPPVEVQELQVIPLQPRLVAHVPTVADQYRPG